MNELTLENVDELTEQVKSLNINSLGKLQGVVDLIFEKAVDEPNFAAIYAIMCRKLSGMRSNVVDIRQENKTNFLTLLLARCEYEFEKTIVNGIARRDILEEIDKYDIEKKKKLIASLNDADHHLCRESVGNIRLIAELFNQNMLRVVYICECIEHLLRTPVDYNIECLCTLLTTSGAKLENLKHKNFNWYFAQMHALAKRKIGPEKLNSKFRHMLYDVINLKARKWEPIQHKDKTMKQPYAVATSVIGSVTSVSIFFFFFIENIIQ